MTKKFLLSTLIPLGIMLAGFITILILIYSVDLDALPADSAIAEWAYSIRGEEGGAFYWFNRIITELGYTYFVVAFIVILGIVWKFRSKTWFMAVTVLISWLLQRLLKSIIERPRPDEAMWWMTESSSSFPSGHSITVACLFVLVIYFVVTSDKLKPWLKGVLSALSALAIFFVGFSRIILGVHYFTDVVAGLLFGASCAILGIIAYQIYLDIKKKKKDKMIEKYRLAQEKGIENAKFLWF